MENRQLELKKDWDQVWLRKGLLSKSVSFGRNVYNSFFERLLLRYINPETELIELGCGTASLGFLLASKFNIYHGVDISPVIIETAQNDSKRKGIDNMTFSVADCRNLGQEYENKFDLAWSQGLVEHFDDPGVVVWSHISAVKPGGTVLISVPYKYSYHNLWYKITRPKMFRKFWPWTEQRFFSSHELANLGKESNISYRVFMLAPNLLGFLLGIIILEIKKPIKT